MTIKNDHDQDFAEQNKKNAATNHAETLNLNVEDHIDDTEDHEDEYDFNVLAAELADLGINIQDALDPAKKDQVYSSVDQAMDKMYEKVFVPSLKSLADMKKEIKSQIPDEVRLIKKEDELRIKQLLAIEKSLDDFAEEKLGHQIQEGLKKIGDSIKVLLSQIGENIPSKPSDNVDIENLEIDTTIAPTQSIVKAVLDLYYLIETKKLDMATGLLNAS